MADCTIRWDLIQHLDHSCENSIPSIGSCAILCCRRNVRHYFSVWYDCQGSYCRLLGSRPNPQLSSRGQWGSVGCLVRDHGQTSLLALHCPISFCNLDSITLQKVTNVLAWRSSLCANRFVRSSRCDDHSWRRQVSWCLLDCPATLLLTACLTWRSMEHGSVVVMAVAVSRVLKLARVYCLVSTQKWLGVQSHCISVLSNHFFHCWRPTGKIASTFCKTSAARKLETPFWKWLPSFVQLFWCLTGLRAGTNLDQHLVTSRVSSHGSTLIVGCCRFYLVARLHAAQCDSQAIDEASFGNFSNVPCLFRAERNWSHSWIGYQMHRDLLGGEHFSEVCTLRCMFRELIWSWPTCCWVGDTKQFYRKFGIHSISELGAAHAVDDRCWWRYSD